MNIVETNKKCFLEGESPTLSDLKKWSSTALNVHSQVLESERPLEMMKNAFYLKYSCRSHNI